MILTLQMTEEFLTEALAKIKETGGTLEIVVKVTESEQPQIVLAQVVAPTTAVVA